MDEYILCLSLWKGKQNSRRQCLDLMDSNGGLGILNKWEIHKSYF